MNKQSKIKKLTSIIKENSKTVNICYSCLKIQKLDDGDYSPCCDDLILSSKEMLKALRGKIPKINPHQPVTDRKKKKKSNIKRDPETGLRLGTTKYKAYKLWKKGMTCKKAAIKLEANESSIRSWFGTFNRRWKNHD